MAVSIGIISAQKSMENICGCRPEMSKKCRVTCLPYHTLQDLRRIYVQNMWKFDGFLFSGCFPKDYLEENIGPIAKPYRCLDPRSQDYYLLIARILANNPGIDISRVYIDAIVDPVVVESIIENIFQGKNRPYLPQNHEVMDYRGSLRKSTYDEYMQVYRMLWAQDRFDVFVTRWSNLEERLEAEHIPCILLRPSRETIMYYFSELLHDIRENAVQQSLSLIHI